MDNSHHNDDVLHDSTRDEHPFANAGQSKLPDEPVSETTADIRPALSGTATRACVYPKPALDLLKLKCPTIRQFCTASPPDMNAAQRSGHTRTLAAFDGGEQAALETYSSSAGFNRLQFQEHIDAGRRPGSPRYSCAQARADGSASCPSGGCPLPDGTKAEAPLDLLTWQCNLKGVGAAVIAQSITASEYGDAIVNVRGEPYAYIDGIYRKVNQVELMRKVMTHLGVHGTIKQAKEIAAITCISQPRHLDAIKPNPNFICFKNGTLNVETMQLEAHNPEHMLLNRIPHDYDQTAYCPRFVNFLNQTFAGDPDMGQKINFLAQWFGYLFTADTRLQKMLIMVGEGANGKSVLEGLMERILGPCNVHNAMLHRFRQAYVRAELEAKLLNISADLPKTNAVADGEMKAIVAGDPIEVSPKYQPSYTIHPYCRLVVATNHLPSTKDPSEGFFRRMMILTFNNIVLPDQRDPNLIDALCEEIPGIIAWAVRGLYDLRGRGRFAVPDSSMRAVEAYRADVSPVRLFAEECLSASPDRSGFTAKDLFLAFRKWCHDRGLDPGNMILMGRDLAALGFDKRKSSTIVWLVKAKECGQEYFRPAMILPELPGSSNASLGQGPA